MRYSSPHNGIRVGVRGTRGPWNLGNPGAYGNEGAASADIPAVEFNVVGGTVAALYPGGPALPIEFAITNPGSSGSYVTSVTTSISSVTTNADIPTCSALWYSLSPSTSPYQSATVAIGEHSPWDDVLRRHG